MNCKKLILPICIIVSLYAPVAFADDDSNLIQGGGTTVVTGGTGSTSFPPFPPFTPVITKFAIHWSGGQGRLECLALAPSTIAGTPGSANFDTNIMYVTGPITSVEFKGHTAIMKGTATVIGLGAGTGKPFTATAERGGDGASFVLKVSGLTFDEIVEDGQIKF